MSLATVLTRAQFGLDAGGVGRGLLRHGPAAVRDRRLAEAAVREPRPRAPRSSTADSISGGASRSAWHPPSCQGGGASTSRSPGILSAAPDEPGAAGGHRVLRELSLSGELRPVRGMLATAVQAAPDGTGWWCRWRMSWKRARTRRHCCRCRILASVWAVLRGGPMFGFDARRAWCRCYGFGWADLAESAAWRRSARSRSPRPAATACC